MSSPRALLLGLALAAAIAAATAPGAAAKDANFASPDLKRGGAWEYTFTEVGEYPYVCTYHPAMRGTITVRESAPAAEVVNVTMTDNTFAPASLTLKPGTKVHWVNEGDQVHNAKGTPAQGVPLHPLLALAGIGLAAVLAARTLRR